MFATALNLLPGGQLDGGHMVYALAPRAHRAVTKATIAALMMFGLIAVAEDAHLVLARVHGWEGWLVWALVIAFTGLRHPQVPEWPGLRGGRKALALLALAMLVLTFMPAPFTVVQ
jgi:membrane-associated protease RseP (regulator of RpoE activity)